MKKLICYAAIALGLLPISVGAQAPKITTFGFQTGVNLMNMSDDGLWAVAKGTNGDNESMDSYPYLLNITNGERVSLLTDEETEMGVSSGAYDVSDGGKIVVGNYDGSPAKYENGEWIKLTGENSKALRGNAVSISADGRCIVGTLGDNDGLESSEIPMLWVDGVPTPCPNLPTKDAWGRDENMNRFVGISADGEHILGCLSFVYVKQSSYYVYHRATQTYDILGEGVLTSDSKVDFPAFSPDGKWVTGTVHNVEEIEGSEFPDERELAFQYNLDTKNFVLYNEEEDTDIGGNAIDNSGVVFAATPAVNPVRSLIWRVGQFWYDLRLVLKEKYGIDFIASTGYEYTGSPIAISRDGKTLAAIAMTKDQNYVITLPETFAEAAASVNLLASSTVFPPTGSSFSKLTTVTVSFDKNAKVLSGAKAYLYDGETKVASSLSIKQGSSAKSFVIGFKPITFTEGKRYTLKIPAGCFGFEGTDIVNKDIDVTYIGREDKPVQALKFSPADGSNVSELSYNSPLSIQFDVPLTLVNGVVGTLYQEGSVDPLSELVLATSTNMMAVYPAGKRYLYKDVKYTVKIPAGAVTDLMGNCPNEEISLQFTGLYERPLPQPGDNLFEEDFSDPTNSYNRFLLWDGDKNTPTKEMQDMKFDSSNTPWNFTIRESTSHSDFCVGSTSMYDPAGESNDWMTTIQLYIPSDKYVLSWKSQSYKKDKQDVLRVFVWECDEELSSLNDELVARIEKEGTKVYEAVESPGESEEGLAGEWKENKVALDDYKGKKIYIAFLNRNNDQSMILVDDIKVVYDGNFSLGNMTESIVKDMEEVTVGGYVMIKGEGTYNSIKAYYYNADKSVKDEITETNLNLKAGDIHKFSFTNKLPVEPGRITEYTLGVEVEGDVQEIKSTVKNLAFTPNKKVVIEKLTGAWCQNCPLGDIAFEYLQQQFPDNFIPVAIHTASGGTDPYDFSAYGQFLGLSAAPTGLVNRIDTVYSPIYTGGTQYSYFSPEGNKTFTDIMLRELEVDAVADISVGDAIYDPEIKQIYVPTNVKYALDIPSANYNILYVLLESGLKGKQTNGFHATEDPLLGEWGASGSFGPSPWVTYDHVARMCIGSSMNGTPGYIPNSVTGNKLYEFAMQTDISDVKISDMNKVDVVCMLIDANTGKIENAAISHFTEGTISGIEDTEKVSSDVTVRVDGKRVITEFNEATDAVVTLYDLNGMVIDQASANVAEGNTVTTFANGHNGVVIVKIIANGQMTSKKVFINK